MSAGGPHGPWETGQGRCFPSRLTWDVWSAHEQCYVREGCEGGLSGDVNLKRGLSGGKREGPEPRRSSVTGKGPQAAWERRRQPRREAGERTRGMEAVGMAQLWGSGLGVARGRTENWASELSPSLECEKGQGRRRGRTREGNETLGA